MKAFLIVFLYGITLSATVQVTRQTKPVSATTQQAPQQIRTDTVPVRTTTKPPTGITNKPVTAIKPAVLIASMLPDQNLKWFTYDQVSAVDEKPVIYGYTYYKGEMKYITNAGQPAQWKGEFVWMHIPPEAVSARIEIANQPFPFTEEKNFPGIVETKLIQRMNADSLKFTLFYKEKAASSAPARGKAMPLIKKPGSAQFAGTYLSADVFKDFGNYYVRAVPLDASGNQVGLPGRAVKIVADYISFPKPPVPTSEDSLLSDYEITSVKYTQMHYPEQQFVNCIVVTGYNEGYNTGPLGDKWDNGIINSFKASLPIGTRICPSPPKEKSWYEKAFNSVMGAAEIAINGASKVYSETKSYLKKKFSEYMCNYDPVTSANKKLLEQSGVDKKSIDDGCNTATGVVFEAAMSYAGMPPSIPNFDEMCRMAKGQVIDLLIQKAAEKTGMPCDETCRQLIMEGYDKMVEESAAKNVQNGGFFNYKPDPAGQYRLPYVEIEVTRKRNTQKGSPIISSLSFTPGVQKTFNLKDNKGQSYTKTINSYDLYERIQLPVPYLHNVGDKIKLVAVLTPKFAYANYGCSSGMLMNIDTRQSFCGGINVVETGEDPKNSSGYSMMVDNATININPAGKIKLAVVPPPPGKIGLAKEINTQFPHHQ